MDHHVNRNGDLSKKYCKRGQQRRYVGVRQRPSGRWVAEIKDSMQKVRLWLGTFDTEEAAAKAYDEASLALRGPNARTNFPLPKDVNANEYANTRLASLSAKIRGPLQLDINKNSAPFSFESADDDNGGAASGGGIYGALKAKLEKTGGAKLNRGIPTSLYGAPVRPVEDFPGWRILGPDYGGSSFRFKFVNDADNFLEGVPSGSKRCRVSSSVIVPSSSDQDQINGQVGLEVSADYVFPDQDAYDGLCGGVVDEESLLLEQEGLWNVCNWEQSHLCV